MRIFIIFTLITLFVTSNAQLPGPCIYFGNCTTTTTTTTQPPTTIPTENPAVVAFVNAVNNDLNNNIIIGISSAFSSLTNALTSLNDPNALAALDTLSLYFTTLGALNHEPTGSNPNLSWEIDHAANQKLYDESDLMIIPSQQIRIF